MKKVVLLIFLSISCSLFAKELNEKEIAGILLMREEEKLARDVYLKLYDKWKVNIFKNIGLSEQTHMDRVKDLLLEYEIKDPVDKDIPGFFKNNELQDLYNKLVDRGSKSLYDALFVGATIEDLDILDLDNLIKETDNEYITYIYTNLKNGSINHIKAFNRQLKKYGEGYKAQYITDQYLKEILGE